jgi:subtilisin family serine protease
MVAVLGIFIASTPLAYAQSLPPRASRVAPSDLGDLATPDRSAVVTKIHQNLATLSGPVQVVVRLSAEIAGLAADQRAQAATVTAEQDAVLARIRQIDPNATLLGRTKLVLNALMVEIDAAHLDTLANDLRVRAINPVVDFELDLTETVPYIGATPDVQAAANNGGVGVTVAVLDSGIDYTHANLGGPGTAAAYEAAYGTSTSDPRNTTLDGLFPTEKVVAGYDFVGEVWPNGPLAPDPDPIDFEGHGTHVADIIGGVDGVAPGVSLVAVKVCSAVSSSCNGVALLQGMEFAVDPNQDGDTSDHVDIINMSLGSSYGDGFFDDLSAAVQNATDIGSLTVASAGNSADRPYITGSPAAAPSALSVAQTQVPSAKTFPLVVNSPASIAGVYPNTATVDWAPIGAGFTGDVAYIGRACPGDALLADPDGKVALVDRGVCAVSLKSDVAGVNGAIGVLVANNAPGDPPSFSFGGGSVLPPTLVITQADGNRLKTAITGGATVNVTVSDATSISIVGSMVASSSRGPSSGRNFPVNDNPLGYQFGQLIKPEIGAPGASVSAVAGSGTGTQAFGGTSGAAPMVAGSAALLIASTNWDLTPREVKARLQNTAETEIFVNPANQPGFLAPITRIGNGEVRVDRAIAAEAAAFEFAGAGGSLSFGFVDVNRSVVRIRRSVEVKNYSSRPITFDIASSFRYADDEANGAVTIRPSRNSITVPAYLSRYFMVTVEIDGTKLRTWTMNSGVGGGSSADLNVLEYDGYLTLSDRRDADNNLHLAWHVLPRKSPQVRAPQSVRFRDSLATARLTNRGVADGTYSIYSLIGENPTMPEIGGQGSQLPNVAARYLGTATFPVPTNVCASGLLVEFGVQTWSPVTHANYPLEIDIYLDNNRDGIDDFVIFTAELNLAFAADGRNVVYAQNLATGARTVFFFTRHGTNSSAFVLTVCGEQIGLSGANAGQLVDVDLLTFDNYFTGNLTSVIQGTMSVLGERYLPTDAAFSTIIGQVTVPAGGDTTIGVVDFGDNGATESGLLLLNTRGGATEGLVIEAR